MGFTIPNQSNPGAQRGSALYEFMGKGNLCLVQSIARKMKPREVPYIKNWALEMGLPKLGFTLALGSALLPPFQRGLCPASLEEEEGKAASA